MKVSRIAVTLFAGALLCSASVFAGDSNKGTLRLDQNVTIDGTPVKAGDYKVEWNGNGPDVQVTVLKGKQTVATFPARVAEQATPSYSDAYSSSQQPDGARTVTAIYFGGKHYSLQVQPNGTQTSQQQNNSGSSK